MELDGIAANMNKAGPFGTTVLHYKYGMRGSSGFRIKDTSIPQLKKLADTLDRMEISLTGSDTGRIGKLSGRLVSEWDDVIGIGRKGMLAAVAAKQASYRGDMAARELFRKGLVVMQEESADLAINYGRTDIIVGAMRVNGRNVDRPPADFVPSRDIVTEKEMATAMFMGSSGLDDVKKTMSELLNRGFLSPEEYSRMDPERMQGIAKILLAIPQSALDERKAALDEARRMLEMGSEKVATSIIVGLVERGLVLGGYTDESLAGAMGRIVGAMKKSADGYRIAGNYDAASGMERSAAELGAMKEQVDFYAAMKREAADAMRKANFDGSKVGVPHSMLAGY